MPAAKKARSGGRPWGRINSENEQARKLAEFLRARVDRSGKTLARLATDVSLSKSQVSVYLGGKIPPESFVTAIVNATVPAPLRERELAEARRLRESALHPPKTAGRTVPRSTGG
ncbi:helix-turn-helix transcriptional regulator [Streptomyces sp. NPDC093224]|uniref:helix-turn-helix domain-containing protein n=1 Tax=Streptomyces sp. NPDC093224 TaxID=3155198 RepID=UPI00344843E4